MRRLTDTSGFPGQAVTDKSEADDLGGGLGPHGPLGCITRAPGCLNGS